MGDFSKRPLFETVCSVWERAVQIPLRTANSRRCKTWMCVSFFLLSVLCVVPLSAFGQTIEAPTTRHFEFYVRIVNKTRNCVNKPIVAVNGMYPGPTIRVNEGDRVIAKIFNRAYSNLTIHWHGIRQRLSAWEDGVGYITQCSIQHGDYYTYNFTVTGQRGTTFWHAHVNWVRATVHGAFITKPAMEYPFPNPYKEITVILGEWWNADVETIENIGLAGGGAFKIADALTINGFPGVNYSCSQSEGITTFKVKRGQTYLLRIINAALNSQMFFGIANHVLTVVEADSEYVKPFMVNNGIYLAAGQTMNVLVTANQMPGNYYMAAEAYSSLLITDLSHIPPGALNLILHDVPEIPATALFQYEDAPALGGNSTYFPSLPAYNDTVYRTAFEDKLKSLYAGWLPRSGNLRNMFFVVGLASEPCNPGDSCSPSPFRAAGAVNNITFRLPTIAMLQAFYYNISGVYTTDFPEFPLVPFDYTNPNSPDIDQQRAAVGTRVIVVEYGTVIQLVLQNDNNFGFESHPFHLHGHFFHVLGRGYGNYDPVNDPLNFNYYDPPMRFTVDVQRRGWTAIRFKADNPGAWLIHCHLDKHTSLGMQAAFIVKNGVGPDQTLPPPPRLTKC